MIDGYVLRYLVHVAACLQQCAHDLGMVLGGGVMKGCVYLSIVLVDIRTISNEKIYDVHEAFVRGLEDRSALVRVNTSTCDKISQVACKPQQNYCVNGRGCANYMSPSSG